MRFWRSAIELLALAFSIGIMPASAGLILTPAGVADGFTLTTFVNGYSAQYGPLSQGIAPDGNVITGSLLGTKVYVFKDVDGQTLSSAVTSVPYTCQTGSCNYSMTTAGGQVYGAQATGGTFYQFANDGTSTPIPNLKADGLTAYFGMWGDPVNGHIIASSNKGLVEIDPVAGTFRVITATVFPDGLTVSPDGQTTYVAIGGGVRAYDIATGALIRTFSTGHGPDGMGVISGGSLSGQVIVNNNDGTVGLLDPTKAAGDPSLFTLIATGGTRGDFVSADTSNGTLFLSQNEQVARLSCGPDCVIGSTNPGTPSVPEPGTAGLLSAGLAGVVLFLRTRNQSNHESR